MQIHAHMCIHMQLLVEARKGTVSTGPRIIGGYDPPGVSVRN